MSVVTQTEVDGVTYDIQDANAQPKTLVTPLTIGGTSQTTVEGALGALNNRWVSINGTDITFS